VVEKREQIEALSKNLLEKETLDLRAIRSILGDRPFPAKSNYKAYLEVVEEAPPAAPAAPAAEGEAEPKPRVQEATISP
jgi:hypothetical protein